MQPSSEDAEGSHVPRLSLYLDLLGPGLLYSLNVDLVIADVVALRAGYSSFTFFGDVTLFPVMVSYLGYGSANHRYELGVGAVISDGNLRTEILPTGLIGYRYQPVDGGFLFRVGAVLLVGIKDESPIVLPWPYLSLGATF